MSASVFKIASELADETVKIMKETDQDRLYYDVAQVLGAASQTLEEAYLTEIRIRLAGEKAWEFLKQNAQN